MKYDHILKIMESVTKSAGQYLLTQSINVKGYKTRNDLLTENDLTVENFIIEGIKKEFPDINIISEEYNPNNSLIGLTVVIDPIDGTCNFAVGIPLYGIQLALFDGKELCGAVLYFPTKDTVYTAQKGKGAYKNGTRLVADSSKKAADGFLLISDYYDNIDIDFDKQFGLIKVLQPHFLKTRHFGAACVDFTLLAENYASAYITYYHKIWDIAPGLLLAKEAGFVTAAVDTLCYEYNRPGLIVAANDEIIKIIKDAAESLGI